jgi:CHAD domain-containing protein
VTEQPEVPTGASNASWSPAHGPRNRRTTVEPTAAQVVGAVLSQFASNFLLNDPGAEALVGQSIARVSPTNLAIPGHDPRRRESAVERIHQARVSVRRLRSTLRTYGGLIEPEWASALAGELSWYGDVLGVARDLDVLRGTIVDSLRLVDDESLRESLVGHLDQSIKDAATQGVEQRATARYARLIDDLASIDAGVRFVDRANGPASEVLETLLDRTWIEALEAYRGALKRRSNRRLHRLRITLKRLQYASETVGVVRGKAAVKTARAAEELQTRLGMVHDANVAIEWLREFAVGEAKHLEALRDLMVFHKTARKEARRGWRGAMRRIERSWRRWHDE